MGGRMLKRLCLSQDTEGVAATFAENKLTQSKHVAQSLTPGEVPPDSTL